MSAVRASLLIPTHDHASTLPLTVASVLRQSVADLEVLLIGDGVSDELRTVIEGLVDSDPRVRFLDFPKGPHHGEIYRHEAVLTARSDAIFYLCDDDLLLPDHVSDLLACLAQANFVQSRNGFITTAGEMGLYPTDLGDPACVAWHLGTPRRNMTSITGTAHSREFYLRLDRPWETTPPGEWPDHFQWKKFFRHPDFRGATSARMTALQLPTSQEGRDSWTPQQRYDELAAWAALVSRPDAQAQIDALVDAATQRALATAIRTVSTLQEEALALQEETRELQANALTLQGDLDDLRDERDELRIRLKNRNRRLARVRAEVAALRSSRSWRVTAPLRKLRRRR